MNSFYSKLYDPVKDRRYGMLFLITVVISICLYALGLLADGILDRLNIEKSDLKDGFRQALPGILILTVALIWRGSRRNRARKKEKFQRRELSREEIRKARSKLVKTKN